MLRLLAALGVLGLGYYLYRQSQQSSEADIVDANFGDSAAPSNATDVFSGSFDVFQQPDVQAPYMNGSQARGVANNNPFNIKFNSANAWRGQTGSDGTFCTFDTPEDGYRAGFMLLLNWNKKYGLNTVRQIISRQAPPSENSTENYIQYVAGAMGVNPDDQLQLFDGATITNLATAITHMEQGGNPWPAETILAGMTDAFASEGIALA